MRCVLSMAVIAVAINSQVHAGLIPEYESNRIEVLANLDFGQVVTHGMLEDFRHLEKMLEISVVYPEVHLMIAAEINASLEYMAELLNVKRHSRYVFGGWNGVSVAYSFERTDGAISSISYSGSGEDYYLPISDQGDSLPLVLRGEALFGMAEGTVFDSIVNARDLLLTGDLQLINDLQGEMLESLKESQDRVAEGYMLISDRITFATSIPEPCSILLFGIGAVLLRGRRRV